MFFRCLTMRLDCLCDLDHTDEAGRRQRQCGCMVKGVKKERVLHLCKQFRRHTRQEVSTSDFGGVSYDDLVYVEECFDLSDRVCTVETTGRRSSGTWCFLTSKRDAPV